ncbi:Gamma-tubulin complex component 4 [Rhizophlyctis rosea]|uniref:Spindle pole body component n=1 Tax=Rhizophlyctis rosea TaxID=64517 RepID=A0AAD5SDJ1_9FUNG|nr:Gamma-tubulin complex component 4 [Rhizophlyctis rosea]
MLHELLLTLSGHPGDVFAPSFNTPARDGEGFSIPPDFPFLHSAERYALERLAVLGYYYQNFTTFINSGRKGTYASRRSNRNDTNGPYGSYFRAFCSTLDKELEEYRELIIECETRILSKLDLETDGGRTPVSYLEHKFAKFHLVFPHINDVISVIDANPAVVHGMRLLNLLHERNATGLPYLREMFTRLLLGTSQVFIKQLVAWVAYGQLIDPHLEFFVRVNRKAGNVEHKGKNGTLAQEQTKWQSEYVLDSSFSPKFIGSNIGDEVLFIGKAVNVINQLDERNGIPEFAFARLSPITEHDLNRSFWTILKKSGMTDNDALSDNIKFEILKRGTITSCLSS